MADCTTFAPFPVDFDFEFDLDRALQSLNPENPRFNKQQPLQQQHQRQHHDADTLAPSGALAPSPVQMPQPVHPEHAMVNAMTEEILSCMNNSVAIERKMYTDSNLRENTVPLNARELCQSVDDLHKSLSTVLDLVASNPIDFRFALTEFLIKIHNVLDHCGSSNRGWIVGLIKSMLFQYSLSSGKSSSSYNKNLLLSEACILIRNIAPYLPSDTGLFDRVMSNVWELLWQILLSSSSAGRSLALAALQCILTYAPIEANVVYTFTTIRVKTPCFYSRDLLEFRCARLYLATAVIHRLRTIVEQDLSSYHYYMSAVPNLGGSYSSEKLFIEFKLKCVTYLCYLIKECRVSYIEESELGIRDTIVEILAGCRLRFSASALLPHSTAGDAYSPTSANNHNNNSDIIDSHHSQPDSDTSSRMRANWLLFKRFMQGSKLLHRNKLIRHASSVSADMDTEEVPSESGASSSVASSFRSMSSATKVLYRDFVKWTAWCKEASRKHFSAIGQPFSD